MDIKTIERCLNASKRGIAFFYLKERGFQIKDGNAFINNRRLNLHDDGFSVEIKSDQYIDHRNHFYHQLPAVIEAIIDNTYDRDYSIR